MADNDAIRGPWMDYNRRYLDQWQYLTDDFHAQLMTAIVAVCLTLINPCVFRIATSFGAWLFGTCFPWIGAQWSGEKPNTLVTSPTGTDEQRALLSERYGRYYSTTASSKSRSKGKPTTKKHRVNGETLWKIVPKIRPTRTVIKQGIKGKDQAHPTEDAGLRTSTSPKPNIDAYREQPSSKDAEDLAVGSSNDNVSIAERRPKNTGDATITVRGSQTPITIVQGSDSSRDAFMRLVSWLIHQGHQQWASPAAYVVVIVTVLFGVFVALSVAGVFSAKIQSDKVGLSNSPRCGIWRPDEKAGVEVADREALRSYDEEAQASQYARNCYGSQDQSKTLSCGYFYNESIHFTTTDNQECPFTSKEMCLGGFYSAITFDTGKIDASVLGINARQRHMFRRKTTCSPLNMSTDYIKKSSRAGIDSGIDYYYGSTDDGFQRTDYTFNSSGNPFNWLIPAYSMSTFQWSSLQPTSAFWTPIPELRPRDDGSTLTIMFISSMHIYHVQESTDPIFPARESRNIPGQRDPLFYNADPKATVLACADTTELCSPDGKVCWNMNAAVPEGFSPPPSYWMMKWSLENLDTYNSIQWRLGNALLAQEKISQSTSRPLARNQWQLETKQMFATSLARIQYDTRKIALGVDSDHPQYVEETPDEARDHLCGIYKFKTPKYNNINLKAFIGLILLSFAIFVLSLPAGIFGYKGTSHQATAPSCESSEEATTTTHIDETSCGDEESPGQDSGPPGHDTTAEDAHDEVSFDPSSELSTRASTPAFLDDKVPSQHGANAKDPLVIDVICRSFYSLLASLVDAFIWLLTSSFQEKRSFLKHEKERLVCRVRVATPGGEGFGANG